MAYRYGDRIQMTLLPPSIEEYVADDAPVRAYDAFVEALDFDKLGIRIDPDRVGNSSYDPRAMLKLLVYGYSYGVRSSRKLEREAHNNLSFIWLMGGLKPDHKTIAEFRRNNKTALKGVLKQCARLCIKLDLIAGNTLFVDGTKIRANASIKNTWDKKKCERALKKIDKSIDEILCECEAADEAEADHPSLVVMNKELGDKKALKEKVKDILSELEENGEKSLNTVDRECTRINSVQGSHAGYNAQIVADEKNGLIVSSDAVSENNDLNQFAVQIEKAGDTLEKKCDAACADSGYATTDELKKVADREIKVVVPSQRQAADRELKEFDKQNFKYDRENDYYVCPAGEILYFREENKEKRCRYYQPSSASVCSNCRFFGRCTTAKRGRKVMRLNNEDTRLQLEAEYLKPDSQQIYKLRKEKVELPFGHIKRNLNVGSFLMRGLEGAKAEMSLLSTCFNMARMITILGVKGLIAELRRMPALNYA
jgi:transposase